MAAIGTGATQAAGMKVVYGSMGKALHPGKAAMDGLLAGFLARDGFTSSTVSIEGHRGFLHLFSPSPSPHRAVEGLGDSWNPLRQRLQAIRLRLAHTSGGRGVAPPCVPGTASVPTASPACAPTCTTTCSPPRGIARRAPAWKGSSSISSRPRGGTGRQGSALPAQFTDDRRLDPALEEIRSRIVVEHDPGQSKGVGTGRGDVRGRHPRRALGCHTTWAARGTR